MCWSSCSPPCCATEQAQQPSTLTDSPSSLQWLSCGAARPASACPEDPLHTEESRRAAVGPPLNPHSWGGPEELVSLLLQAKGGANPDSCIFQTAQGAFWGSEHRLPAASLPPSKRPAGRGLRGLGFLHQKAGEMKAEATPQELWPWTDTRWPCQVALNGDRLEGRQGGQPCARKA